MKRTRQQDDANDDNHEELGALEFAAALNGEDPSRILNSLKLFVKIVQRERRIALGVGGGEEEEDEEDHSSSPNKGHGSDSNNSDSDSSKDSDDDPNKEETTPSKNGNKQPDQEMKRFKASESWKEDTNQYDVPFVGTSVAKGGRGKIVAGQWPTGLLQEYLERSTRAAELTGDHLIPPNGHVHRTLIRQKQGKLSQAIYKTYLRALAELVTAGIPNDVLTNTVVYDHREQEDDDTENPRFLVAILKERLHPLLKVLQSDNKYKAASCGPLVPSVLHVISNLAATSPRNARTIARELEQSVPESIWRAMIRLPPLHGSKDAVTSTTTTATKKDSKSGGDNKNQKTLTKQNSKNDNNNGIKREEGRTAVLKLTRTLLDSRDSNVAHYIGASGSKERRVSAGILVIALREALRDNTIGVNDGFMTPTRKAYYQEITGLLRTLGSILTSTSKTSGRHLYSTRRWVDLLTSDILLNLCDLSLHAPPLSKPDFYTTVLDGTDDITHYKAVGSITPLEEAGREARRLLWPLLVDPQRSPLIQLVVQQQGKSTTNASNAGDKHHNPSILLLHQLAEQHLVRTMGRLLDTHPASAKLAWQHCLCHGMRATPIMLPALFQRLTVPDPSKHPFAFLAHLRFFSHVIQDGPIPSECLSGSSSMAACVVDANDDPIFRILVPSGLKKSVFSKAMQSKNTMVVAETLKCLIYLVRRIDAVKRDISDIGDTTTFWADLSTKATGHLPDLQVLLSTLSRFDLRGDNRAATVLCGHLCQLLLSYASTLPDVIRDVKFDWIKLLPNQAEVFCGLPLMLQTRLLRTLGTLLTVNETSRVSPASCELLLTIVTTTRAPVVYSRARNICQLMVGQVAPSDSAEGETQKCLKYEISCWVDCMTEGLVAEFCAILEEASQLHFKSEIFLLQAWKKAGLPQPMPALLVSPILMVAMSSSTGGSRSDGMALLLNQIMTKCLLYHHNPLPLAALICYFYSAEKEDPLVQYSSSLTSFETESESKRGELILQLIESTFSKESFHFKILRLLSEDENEKLALGLLNEMSKDDAVAATRQLLHILACSDSEATLRNCLSLIRLLLPPVLEGSSDSNDVLLRHILKCLKRCKFSDSKYIDLCALSSGQEGARSIVLRRLLPLIKTFRTDDGDGSTVSSILSSQATRQDLMSLQLCRKYLSFQLLDDMLSVFADAIAREDADSNAFSFSVAAATCCVQEMLIRSECGASGSFNPFSAWLAITDPRCVTTKRSEVASLASALETLLCRQFSSRSAASTQLYTSTLRHEPKSLVERALTHSLDGTCLVNELLECDPNRFAPALTELLFGEGVPKSITKTWMTGSFDKAVLSVVSDGAVTRELGDEGQQLVDALVHRSRVLVQAINNGKRSHLEKDLIFQLLQLVEITLLSKAEGKDNLAMEMAEFLTGTDCNNILNKTNATALVAFLQATSSINATLDGGNQSQSTIHQTLHTGLFVRLCELLPRALRKTNKAMEENRTNEIIDPSFVIKMLLPLANKFGSFDMTQVASFDSGSTAAALRACLKYGMTECSSSSFTEIASQCLRLARSLVLSVPSEGSKGFPPPSAVYEMIVSHSHFAESLQGSLDDDASESRKLELVHLLLACVSLSKSPINFETDVWNALFGAYGAGLSATDSALRRIFYVATKRQDEGSLPFLDQFRWKGIPQENTIATPSSYQMWDWLANGLQLGRVRQTLRRFPFQDGLVPSPLADVEIWTSNADGDKMDIDEDETIVFDVVNDPEGEPNGMVGNRSVNDASYSPGYVLPLILAALESCMGDPQNTAPQFDRHQHVANGARKGMEVLASMTHRLCEKGGLSLALASLCCKCPSLRKVAVSVISFFMWAIDSQEAREISAWRERPQLAMLLHSVHRFLAVRRSTLQSRKEENSAEPPNKSPVWVVPQLLGFPAVFLARAAFVLTRPGDSMYSPINKYFLSIDKEHGAFKDMNRIPAFIFFLCSSSDEPVDQARNERLWALKLLKAGFLNGSSFKMVSSCHAPELLLTTIYDHRMRHLSRNSGGKHQSEESVVLIQAVSAMVQFGGNQASHQLIGRMGLLSWLRSVLESPVVDQILPSRASRIAFLVLISTSVRQAILYEAYCKSKDDGDDDDSSESDGDSDSSSDSGSNNDGDKRDSKGGPAEDEVDKSHGVASRSVSSFPIEVYSLARPTLMLCLASFGDSQPLGSMSHHEPGSSIPLSSLDVLLSLKSAFQSLSGDLQPTIREDGIPLAPALDYLSKIAASSLPPSATKDAIEALTCLPMTPSAAASPCDKEDAATFCCRVLEVITDASISHLPQSWIVQILTRLSVILQSRFANATFDTELYANSTGITELLEKLLESRTACFQWTESRDLWFVCLQHLLVPPEHSSSDADSNSDVVMKDDNEIAQDGDATRSLAIEWLLKLKLPTINASA